MAVSLWLSHATNIHPIVHRNTVTGIFFLADSIVLCMISISIYECPLSIKLWWFKFLYDLRHTEIMQQYIEFYSDVWLLQVSEYSEISLIFSGSQCIHFNNAVLISELPFCLFTSVHKKQNAFFGGAASYNVKRKNVKIIRTKFPTVIRCWYLWRRNLQDILKVKYDTAKR